ncbi:TPA: LemA domain protein [Bacillus pseudomycoides]|nr:LemA domain protein [Bacillus pseudomycoides]
MEEKEKLLRIAELAKDVQKLLVQESFFNRHPELRGAVENLACSVEVLANMHVHEDKNAEDTLRYVLAKMKIAHNAIVQEREGFHLN